MDNLIKLLPDHVANQIAAGEVIQRPASAVKELLENAIDAGATQITLVIKEAGKTLIQVIDDGKGMSVLDSRMCFERHATSKISHADDLFRIRTMGFRGEALASIAAIAQVDLKSMTGEDEVGTCLSIEGSKVVSQSPCQCQKGTSVAVKNLFFNVPARRNFLKSLNVENRHILEEFIRVACIQHEISFTYYNGDKLLYKLAPGSFKSRIVGLFGQAYNERLLPVEQKTELIHISGFIGKPEYAKKTRGEQYFFVNSRYIKHAYLHHAVTNAFAELIPTDAYPSYFLNIDIDPNEIDINIHPTKTEVNFKDGRLVYAFMQAAIKQAVGKHTLTPQIDFDVDPSVEAAFQVRPRPDIPQPTVSVDREFNPFRQSPRPGDGFTEHRQPVTGDWEKLFRDEHVSPEVVQQDTHTRMTIQSDILQVQNTWLMTNIQQGLLVVHQQRAHERVLYDYYRKMLAEQKQVSQQLLFPEQLTLSANEMDILYELEPELRSLGFVFDRLGSDTLVITGLPPHVEDAQSVVERILENYKNESASLTFDTNALVAKSMATSLAVKADARLTQDQMKELLENLFISEAPRINPNGKRTYVIHSRKDMDDWFR